MTDDEQAAQIDDMCDRWATIPGSFESREQFRLTTGENIDVFVTLGFASMRAAARGLAKTGFGTSTAMPDRDHLYFWAWTGEVFFGKRSPFLGRDNKFDIEIKELAQDVLTIALVIDAPAYVTIEPSQSLKPQLIHDMLMHSFGRLPYLAFPLLEGLVKRSCKDYIKPNGEVRKKWKARGQEIQAGEAGRRTPLL
jgi:hypothetical protein